MLGVSPENVIEIALFVKSYKHFSNNMPEKSVRSRGLLIHLEEGECDLSMTFST